jgi:hypothetical protein
MPSFKYPPLRKDDGKDRAIPMSDSAGVSQFPDRYDRSVRIAVTPEMLQGLQVGDEVEVTLLAKVEGLSSNTNDSGLNRNFLEVQVDEVKTYQAQAERDQSDFGAGFSRGPAPIMSRRR